MAYPFYNNCIMTVCIALVYIQTTLLLGISLQYIFHEIGTLYIRLKKSGIYKFDKVGRYLQLYYTLKSHNYSKTR